MNYTVKIGREQSLTFASLAGAMRFCRQIMVAELLIQMDERPHNRGQLVLLLRERGHCRPRGSITAEGSDQSPSTQA